MSTSTCGPIAVIQPIGDKRRLSAISSPRDQRQKDKKLVTQKLSEALQMSALLLDADRAGYLGHEESLAVQKMKVDFGVICQSVALDLLTLLPEISSAKIALASYLAQLRTSIAQVGFENDDSLMFSYLNDHMHQAIEREGSKSEKMRQVSRLILLLPRLFRWLVVTFFIGMIIFTARDFLGTK